MARQAARAVLRRERGSATGRRRILRRMLGPGPYGVTTPRILIVDDDPNLLVLLADQLRADGYEIATARDGDEALRRLRGGWPDLLIVDMMMPRMDGLSLAREIKTHADLPIIVLSAIDAGDSKADLLEEVAEDYITKPYHYPELRARINRVLRRLGDRAWLDVIRTHNAVIAATTIAHGGTVVETQGDGSMLAFSSARRGVACAIAIQREIESAFGDQAPPIRVRIGIHTGDALQEAAHLFGTTVHYAARVASEARGGEVLVSDVVRALLSGSGITFKESRQAALKGLDGSHQLAAVDLT